MRRSDTISAFMLSENVSPILTPQFYDQTKVTENNPTPPVKITWIGFPKKVRYIYPMIGGIIFIVCSQVRLDNPNDQARWRIADSDRKYQDEYLEWCVAYYVSLFVF